MAFQVRIGGSVENPQIQFSGEESHVIKPEDYDVIGLNMERLKDRIEGGWGGGRPKDIYLKDEGLPWNDQSYGKYGLTQVQVKRRIRNAQIISADTEPFVAIGVPARNASSHKATVRVDSNFSVTHRMGRSWNADVRVGASQTTTIEVGGDAVGAKAGYSQTLSVEAGYGQGGTTEKEEQIGTAIGLDVELEPHSGAQAKLTATRGKIIAAVEYETSWWGHIWVDYGRRVKLVGRGSNPNGHMFYFDPIGSHTWGPKIDRETLEIDLYVNARVDIEDLALDTQAA